MKTRLPITVHFFTALLAPMLLAGAEPGAPEKPVEAVASNDLRKSAAYQPVEGGIARVNGPNYYNRPLYCNGIPVQVLAGDLPGVRISSDDYVLGHFLAAYVRGDSVIGLQDFAQKEAIFRYGLFEWRLGDDRLGKTKVVCEVVPAAEGAGFAVRVRAEGSQPGDRLIWLYGGAGRPEGMPAIYANVSWFFDPVFLSNAADLRTAFRPEACAGNEIALDGNRFSLRWPQFGEHPVAGIAGQSPVGTTLSVADAKLWKDPLKFSLSQSADAPAVCGITPVSAGKPLFWAFCETRSPGAKDAQGVFEQGLERVSRIAARVDVSTPEPMLDASVKAASHAMDGVFYPPVYVHGAMAWNRPYAGWRNLYGPTGFGWHENVMAQGRHFIGFQETSTEKNRPQADPALGLSLQGPESMFYGRGFIRYQTAYSPQGNYNFQTQLFDQLIYGWRHTGDAEFEKLLRPALEMHLDWSRACFDPDGDGCYESYINTWPTDSVWYNGGGSVEESAYIYRGRMAAAEMARRAGDDDSAKAHLAEADKIRRGMMKGLWDADRGHCGVYREQGGHQRLHTDAWINSISLPVDANMITPEQMLTSLYFSEWGLQRVKQPLGGEQCLTSNWVPSLWSVRELYPGDNYDLSLAYFRSGQPGQGWDLFWGNFAEWGFNRVVPGGFSHLGLGVDFTDIFSMFGRVVVEGLFGYQPDYPNGNVVCAPGFPAAWAHASIRTPDFSLKFERKGSREIYSLSLARPAEAHLRIPVSAHAVERVTVNGKPVAFRTEPGVGRTLVLVSAPVEKTVDVEVLTREPSAAATEQQLQVLVGQVIQLSSPSGELVSISDPQNALASQVLKGGSVEATVGDKTGNRMLIARVKTGDLEQWQFYKLHITSPAAEARQAHLLAPEIPATPDWHCVDMTAAINGDIRTIFQQAYISPRPDTCSARIAINGYQAWTMVYWDKAPPVIDLDNLPQLLNAEGRIQTARGVPFAPPASDKNAAIVSLWDNWPNHVSVDVNKCGRALWLLVAGSTNPMQTRIANATVRLQYADGVEETIDLVPPLNFWAISPFGPADYNPASDGFTLAATLPETLQLGKNCRAIVLNRRLRPDVALKKVTVEAMSQEVVIGLMGLTIMR